jgi:hypothetical protein
VRVKTRLAVVDILDAIEECGLSDIRVGVSVLDGVVDGDSLISDLDVDA